MAVAPLEPKPSTDAQRPGEGQLDTQIFEGRGAATNIDKRQYAAPSGSGGIQLRCDRPTTIEGWTLREVMNGTAVLEGPNGTWHVTRGDAVPGVGKVVSIFRWGNRLMVATSGGLISAP